MLTTFTWFEMSKLIRVDDDVYEMIVAEMKGKDTFSDVVRRKMKK